MNNYQKLFISIPTFLFASITLPVVLTPTGTVIVKEFGYILSLLYIPISLSMLYLMIKMGDPKKRKSMYFLIPVFGFNAMVFIALGIASGLQSSKFIGGHILQLTATETFSEQYTCIKSDKNRYTGWVNFVKDKEGNELKVEGFSRFCDIIRFSDPPNKFMLSGRKGYLGMIIEKVEGPVQ